jgi:hypothetical protein
MKTMDRFVYLAGDEDGDVGVQCRLCDRGGAPIIFYTIPETNHNPYKDTDVVLVHSIVDLLDETIKHIQTHIDS